MAYERIKTKHELKMNLNYGEVGGKIVKTSKTYGDIKEGVTDEAFLATAAAITSMQEPIREKQVKMTAEDLVEVA